MRGRLNPQDARQLVVNNLGFHAVPELCPGDQSLKIAPQLFGQGFNPGLID